MRREEWDANVPHARRARHVSPPRKPPPAMSATRHPIDALARRLRGMPGVLALWLTVQIPLFRLLGEWTGDTGKEFGVPRDLLAGQILYRDTFWPYGPFPAYLNAVLVGVFGTHADVLLIAARLLGLAICLAVYRLVRRFAGPGVALAAAGAVLGFSGTSGYFAVPYAFATLWACLLGLLGMDCLLQAETGRQPHRWFFLAGCCGALLFMAKFTVLLPLAVPAVLVAWRESGRGTGKRDGRRLAARIAWLAAPTVLVALPVYAWFAWRTGWDSFALQALGGFHSHNIRHGFLYQNLWRTMRLGDGHGPREMAAAGLVWGVLALAAWAAATGALARRRNLPWPPGPFVLFALLNLGQLNSTVHIPYVFPAVLVAALWGTTTLEAGGAAWLRPLRWLALLAVLTIPLARLPLLFRKTVPIDTPSASLRFAEIPGRALARTVALIEAESPPGEPLGILTGHDFLHQILDRPNHLGYYYTLYEPFWRPWAEERFLRRFEDANFRFLVTHTEESFSHAYILDIHRTRERILGRIFDNYEPTSGEDCLPYVVWKRRP